MPDRSPINFAEFILWNIEQKKTETFFLHAWQNISVKIWRKCPYKCKCKLVYQQIVIKIKTIKAYIKTNYWIELDVTCSVHKVTDLFLSELRVANFMSNIYLVPMSLFRIY